ncbi:MAG TPA: hypothetical protein P5320_04795 [Bacteroidales bacterium]|nr:hypothetical protein [Bacteroidales bacterium]HOK74610.1 hypothetical protein [Bacteroidales bacterium]HOM39743.1 hypothetical protein [Bacteroidales bacterium]HOU30233.1 hypothetical protein [Bacteroidales bacterium]HPP91299.1 hypothetical protein [Bacteroidales bacterium]
MNRSDFLNLLKDPGKINQGVTAELRELVGIYPWFQSAHLLLLKGMHTSGDVRFENQLRQSALFVASREVLYYLLHPVNTRITGMEKPVVKITIPDVPDSQQVVLDTARNSEEVIRMLEREEEEVALASGRKAPGRVKTTILATDSNIDESATVTIIYEDGDETIKESLVYIDPSITQGKSLDILELDESKPVSGTPEEIPEEIPAEIPPELLQEVPAEIPSEIPAEITLELTSEVDTSNNDVTEVSKPLSQAELIERFILSNPKIEPVREKRDEPLVDISRPFTEETGGFVTETLAKIYVSQGYFSKAIDIYEKLSLKYPEKSSYFASRIEEIKKLIK